MIDTKKLRESSVSEIMTNSAVFLLPMSPKSSSSYAVISLTSLMSNGASLAPQDWEKYESCNEAYVTREKAVVFGLSFEKIAHADVLLNVSPFFNHGAHDRIFAGMANHCTVLTDQNPYLKRILKDGEQVCMYSLKDIRTLSDYAAELLTNHALCRDIQNNAYVEFKQKYTWEEKAKQLLACTLR